LKKDYPPKKPLKEGEEEDKKPVGVFKLGEV